jgi:predicted transposase/invertase (TIGR01784 family)
VEIETMLQVTDVTQTRVFQEALEQGRQEGRQEGRDEGVETIARRMIEKDRPVAEIVELTGLTAADVRKLKKRLPK